MAVWAAVVALGLGALGIVTGDPSSMLAGAAELLAVVALFTLICAAEALN